MASIEACTELDILVAPAMFSRRWILAMIALHGMLQTRSAIAQRPGADARKLWAALKQALLADDGDEYFRTHLKDAVLSPLLRGFVVSIIAGAQRPKILVALSDRTTAEVTLLIEREATDSKVKAGDEVEFLSVGVGFVKSPFMLTAEVLELHGPIG